MRHAVAGALAHNLYTLFEVEELAGTLRAIERLLTRAKDRANDPELFAGLVLALRFGGLMEASVAADRAARSLDPVVLTSVEYTHFMTGDYPAALRMDRDGVLDGCRAMPLLPDRISRRCVPGPDGS